MQNNFSIILCSFANLCKKAGEDLCLSPALRFLSIIPAKKSRQPDDAGPMRRKPISGLYHTS